MESNLKNLFDFSDTPVWFMRQAGRYMTEYNSIKKDFNSFFDMCRNVNAVKEITMLPIKKFNFDAGIIFSDILIILETLNIEVSFIPSKGPTVKNSNLFETFNYGMEKIDYDKLSPVYQSIKEVKKLIKNYDKPLIGFSGAPWTVAAYLVEGNITKDLAQIKEMSCREPILMNKIINLLTNIITEHLSAQIKSGADIVQIFDTHSNVLDYNAIEKYSIAPIRKICKEIKKRHPEIPISYFSKNINYDYQDFFDHMDIVSFGSAVRMKKYINVLPEKLIFQGNLDPIRLLVGGNEMKEAIISIMKDMREKDFIFNLGHGILPKTPTKNVEQCIDIVKTFKG